MFDPSKAIKKMLGPGINVPRYRQGKSTRDSDGDGINDIMDCQPKNMFRQDEINLTNIEVPKGVLMQSFTGFKTAKGDSPTRDSFIRKKIAEKGYILKRVIKQEKIGERGNYKIYNFILEVEERKKPYLEKKREKYKILKEIPMYKDEPPLKKGTIIIVLDYKKDGGITFKKATNLQEGYKWETDCLSGEDLRNSIKYGYMKKIGEYKSV